MKKIFFILIAVLSVSLVFTSCLKDTNGGKNLSDATGVSKVFEIAPMGDPNSGTVNDRVKIQNFAPSTTPTTLEIPIYLATAGATFDRDVIVTVQRDPTSIANYNTQNGTSYTFLPNNTFTEESLTITIPKGTNYGLLKVKLFTNLIGSNTGLAYKITSVPDGSVISDTRNYAIYLIAIQNKYDGKYRLKGYHNRDVPDYRIPYDVTVYMITSGTNSVVMWYPNPGPDTYAHPINGNAGSYYGSLSPDVTFDPVTNNAVGIQNWAAYGATPPMSFPTGTGISNKCTFDATTGKPVKMFLLWRYNANDLRRFYDTLTYIGPR